jgi:hypothetical protein
MKRSANVVPDNAKLHIRAITLLVMHRRGMMVLAMLQQADREVWNSIAIRRLRFAEFFIQPKDLAV